MVHRIVRGSFVLAFCFLSLACNPRNRDNLQTAVNVINQTRDAVETVWLIVPDEIRQEEHDTRCASWSDTEHECPTLQGLIDSSLEEAIDLINSTENESAAPIISEITRAVSWLCDLLKSHGLPIPAWVSLSFDVLASILPLILPLIL